MSFLERLRTGLRRTADQLRGRLDDLPDVPPVARGAPGGGAAASIDTLDALEEVLLEADLGVAATTRLVDAVRDGPGNRDLRAVVRAELLRVLEAAGPAPTPAVRPRVVLVVGVNGTGKTTTVGRLARLIMQAGETPVICAADTFRAAAVEQLEVWARRADADFVRARPGSDPAAVVFDAISSGKAKGRDAILCGHRRAPPHPLEPHGRAGQDSPGGGSGGRGRAAETLLVLDATVGQNGLSQARAFLESAGVTGIVLTKLDGTAKGGIAAAVTAELGVPIRYVGWSESRSTICFRSRRPTTWTPCSSRDGEGRDGPRRPGLAPSRRGGRGVDGAGPGLRRARARVDQSESDGGGGGLERRTDRGARSSRAGRRGPRRGRRPRGGRRGGAGGHALLHPGAVLPYRPHRPLRRPHRRRGRAQGGGRRRGSRPAGGRRGRPAPARPRGRGSRWAWVGNARRESTRRSSP